MRHKSQIEIPAAVNKRGFGIVEIVIAVGVISAALFAVMTVARTALELNRRVLLSTQAGFLLEEGSEGIRAMRDANWTNISGLSVGAPYRLYFTGKEWQATTATTLIDGVFDRTVVASDVYRDANSDIAVSGNLDAGTKKLEVTVSWWNGKATSSKNIILYLTDLFN